MALDGAEYMVEMIRRAADGDQGCVDWLEHHCAKISLRQLSALIREDGAVDDKGQQKEGEGQ